MKKIDTEKLVVCIERCFNLSMDGRLSQARRSEMLALGKRLRGSLINHLTATFPDDLKQVDDANKQLQEVNKTLADANAAINKIADTVKEINKLVTVLDKVLKFAANFL